ncbi:MAG: hypothetical protein K8963_05275, partial [Proteobacteria bacterium]|nr:hypothetical protein [Pseudomonadota bacterium]
SCDIDGVLQGTGQRDYTIRAVNVTGQDEVIVRYTVNPVVPNLTEPPAQTFVVGETVNFALTNTGGGELFADTAPVPGCRTDTPLPTELSLRSSTDASTCTIVGTPTDALAATVYRITATSVSGAATVAVSLEVIKGAPDLVNPGAQTFITTDDVSVVYANNGGAVQDLDGCLAPDGLPPGLAFTHWPATSSCRLHGRATRTLPPGLYRLQAINQYGNTQTTIAITVLSGLAQFDTPPLLQVRTGTNVDITLLNHNSHATPIDTCSAPLPPGLSVSSFTNPAPAPSSGSIASQASGSSGGMPADSSGGGLATLPVDSSGGMPADLSGGMPVDLSGGGIATLPVDSSGGGIASQASGSSGGMPAGSSGGGIASQASGSSGGMPAPSSGSIATLPGDSSGGSIASQASGSSGGSFTDNGANGCRLSGRIDSYPGYSTPETFVLTAVNAGGSVEVQLTLQILPRPPQLTALLPTPVVFALDEPVSPIVLPGSGGAPLSCQTATATPLPDGLRVQTAPGGGCQILGTPQSLATVSTYTIIAINDGGQSTAQVTLSVVPRPPALVSVSAQILVQDAPVNIVLTNPGGAPDANGCTVHTPLPAGLSIVRTDDGRSCQITGSPDQLSTPLVYRISATNISGTSTANVSLEVVYGVASFADPGKLIYTVGNAVNTVFNNTSAANTPVSLCSATLPAGLMTTTQTSPGNGCTLQGTPEQATSAGSYTLTATNAIGQVTLSLVIEILPRPPVTVATTTLIVVAGATMNDTLPLVLSNSGGSPTASSGCQATPALPDGLSFTLSTDGASCQVDGVTASEPRLMAARHSRYTLMVSNASGSANTTLDLAIQPAPPQPDAIAPLLVSTSENVGPIAIINHGGIPFAVNGCTVNPALPDGLRVEATPNSLSCQLIGAARSHQPLTQHTITLIGPGGQGQTTLPLTVLPPIPNLAQIDPQSYNNGAPVHLQLGNTGGNPASCTLSSNTMSDGAQAAPA